MKQPGKRVSANFFERDNGSQPVREWLLSLSAEDRKAIGDDIRTVEFGWPLGMPLCRSVVGAAGLWEIRTRLAGGRIARVLFCLLDGHLVLLHGFEKKSQKLPAIELENAIRRMKGL
jgi:phage-related protein